MKFDWVIVGAGFTGATLAERIATVRNERVLVVEQRDHIGGNAYDEYDENGVLRHVYGPHIFHTNSEKVWRYLQSFSAWRPYYHRVHAVVDGKHVPVPVNLNTIEALFPARVADKYIAELTDKYRYGERVPVLKQMREADGPLAELAHYVYDRVFKSYTKKQWGLEPQELSPSVTARVPIIVSRDDRYFQDRWQAMPTRGYTALFRKLLAHKNISVLLGTEYSTIASAVPGARTIYSGPIDQYFSQVYGPLPYRSVSFAWETKGRDTSSTAATLNFPNDFDFTRHTDIGRLTDTGGSTTSRVYEYPCAHVPSENDPYYPIPAEQNASILERYRAAARKESTTFFCGRLGSYQYYNMDQAVAAALSQFGALPQ